MEKDDDFLKKVYDKYLGSDYQFGDADLNPKREIKKTDEDQWEEDQDKILDIIKDRLKNIKENLSELPKYKSSKKVNDNDFNTMSFGGGIKADPSPKVNKNEIVTQITTGGDPNDLCIFIPPFNNSFIDNPKDKNLNIPDNTPSVGKDKIKNNSSYFNTMNSLLDTSIGELTFDDKKSNDQIDDLTKEVDNLLLQLLVPSGNIGEIPPGLNDTLQMFNPSCDEIFPFNDSSNEFNNNDFENDGSFDNNNLPDDSGDSSELKQDKNKNDKNNIEKEDIKECFKLELEILRIILVILKIIAVIKKIISLVFSIVIPLSKIITLVCMCWINPPSISEMINIITEKVVALAVSLVGQLLGFIWGLLNFDCVTDVTQEILDEIKKTISGVGSVINSSKDIISFVTTEGQSLSQTFDKLNEEAKKAEENWSKFAEDFKNKENWESSLKEGALNGIGLSEKDLEKGKEGEASKKVLSSLLPPGLKKLYNDIIKTTSDILTETQNIAKSVNEDESASVLESAVGVLGTVTLS